MKTLDLHEAAALLKLHPDTLQRRAKAGEIPGAKPGKAWVFLDEDLIAWLRGQYDVATKLTVIDRDENVIAQGRDQALSAA